MPTQFRDASGQERLLGTIYVPGATVGDVFTVQADGSLSPAPGGGAQPVSCVVSPSTALDLKASSPQYFVWDTIYDNLVDLNVLGDLPDGLGIDPESIGTDTLTTTEAGVWSFTLSDLGIGNDDTWKGTVIFGNYNSVGPRWTLPVNTAGGREVTLSQTVNLPGGSGFSVGITNVSNPTANPYNVGAGLVLAIVRLA